MAVGCGRDAQRRSVIYRTFPSSRPMVEIRRTNNSFYITCESDLDIPGDTGCNLTNFSSETNGPFHDFQAIGGTSAAAPVFAGIMALVNQKTGQRQGNANVTLYAMAKSETFSSCNSSDGTSGSATNTTCVFNDITKGNNSVPCAGGSTNCSKTSSGGFGVLASGTTPSFAAGVGYDLATGLGSINVANLINKWSHARLDQHQHHAEPHRHLPSQDRWTQALH